MIEVLLVMIPVVLLIGAYRLFIATGDEYYIPPTKKRCLIVGEAYKKAPVRITNTKK